MNDKTSISRAALFEILAREYQRLKAPACDCHLPMPSRVSEGHAHSNWNCFTRACEFGCHQAAEWMVSQYSKQYRLRDLCDTQC
jgi:hypothetical protein